MAINDEFGVAALHGSLLYGGSVATQVLITAHDHDPNFRLLQLMDGLRDGDEPVAPGPSGYVYRMSGSGPTFQTLAEAKAWADGQP